MKRICFFKISIIIVTIISFFVLPLHAQKIEELQREFIESRFGAFFHFGIRTFTGGSWGEPNQDVSKFNPTYLDCGQWADALKAATELDLSVFNLLGQKVKTLKAGYHPRGKYQLSFDTSDLPAGIFYYELRNPHENLKRKCLYL